MGRAQLGHVGVKKIDEVYGRWTRTPEEEPLDLDGFFLQVMRLPKTALRLQRLPNLSQTAKEPGPAVSKRRIFKGFWRGICPGRESNPDLRFRRPSKPHRVGSRRGTTGH